MKNNKATLVTNGEIVTVGSQTRNIGHGIEYQVTYSDDSTGWENVANLIF